MEKFIFLMPCILLIFIGIGIAIYFFVKNKKYKAKTEALIVNIKGDNEAFLNNDTMHNYLAAYYPTYRFDYNGQTYEVTSSLCAYPDSKLKIGNYDTLYFDPKNPHNFITKAQKKSLIVKCVCFILVPIIFAFIMLFSI